MEKALAIANYFIVRGVEAECPPTQMKLQKLVYFAHGWHLALCDEPLVEETFQAWKYGPVIPSLYLIFRDYGISPITKPGSIYLQTFDMEYADITPEINNLPRLKPFLDKIQEVYGKWNGTQLSALTHMPDTPWSQVRKGRPEDARDIAIPNNIIRDFFKKKAENGTQSY